MRQTTLSAFLAVGPTYSEFSVMRDARYQKTGLGLLLNFITGIVLLRVVDEERATTVLLSLASTTKDLAALAPHWNPLSLKCFTACFDNFPRRTPPAIAEELEHTFYECCPSGDF